MITIKTATPSTGLRLQRKARPQRCIGLSNKMRPHTVEAKKKAEPKISANILFTIETHKRNIRSKSAQPLPKLQTQRLPYQLHFLFIKGHTVK